MNYSADVRKSSDAAVIKTLTVTAQDANAVVSLTINGESRNMTKTGSVQYSGFVSIPAGEGPGVVRLVVTVRNGNAASRYHLAVNWQHLEYVVQ